MHTLNRQYVLRFTAGIGFQGSEGRWGAARLKVSRLGIQPLTLPGLTWPVDTWADPFTGTPKPESEEQHSRLPQVTHHTHVHIHARKHRRERFLGSENVMF